MAQALKVRLIHATIRYLILRGASRDAIDAPPVPPLAPAGSGIYHTLYAHGWDTSVNGLPCNQEELAYTLLTFSYVFVRGLRTLHRNGEELPLTTGEFAMLKTLVRHPRQPLSREKLAQLARGREFEPFDRSLDVQVSRLRKLIEVDAAVPRYIQTVWGIGYVFVPDGTN